MHTSIKLDTPCEIINVTPLNPLISKCQIKVCYVGDEPNRNRSIITKSVARDMANSLPGSPIVGFFNEDTGDFEEHNRLIDISGGKFRIKDTTRPYGFVDLNAKVWFQKFSDDGIEHEYLMTEGWLWTGQYPETKRILERGNNHSMELDENLINAEWTKDGNGEPQFFIINEAIISKLCILGEDYEPCFEGSQITPVQFSFEDSFKQQLFSMMNELKELLEKGGTQVFTTYAVKVGDSLWSALYNHVHEWYNIVQVCEDDGQKYAVLQDKNDNHYGTLNFSVAEDGTVTFAENVITIEYTPAEEPQFALADVEAFEVEFKKAKEDEGKDDESDSSDSEDKSEDENSEEDSEDESDDEDEDKKDEEDKKKKQYILEEIPEYIDLQNSYSELESKYNALVAEKEDLESQIQPLKQFKLDTERIQKQEMINKTFYMLSQEDKQDVIDNIDTYSLDDIEAKLSVICFRNKISFEALDDEEDLSDPTTYNLGGDLFNDESTPAWVKAVLDTAKTLN